METPSYGKPIFLNFYYYGRPFSTQMGGRRIRTWIFSPLYLPIFGGSVNLKTNLQLPLSLSLSRNTYLLTYGKFYCLRVNLNRTPSCSICWRTRHPSVGVTVSWTTQTGRTLEKLLTKRKIRFNSHPRPIYEDRPTSWRSRNGLSTSPGVLPKFINSAGYRTIEISVSLRLLITHIEYPPQ